MMQHYQVLLDNWDYYVNTPTTPGKRKTKRLPYDDNNIWTFDIETSSAMLDTQKISWCYIWMLCVNGVAFYGRHIEDVCKIFRRLDELGARSVCYIHNLGYEFQFLRDHVHFSRVFARKERKPMFCEIGNTELRCSYFLSNMSLSGVSTNYNTYFKKASGTLDYTLIRTPDTPLTEIELSYCEYDVLSLWEYIKRVKEEAGGHFKNIPYTSTGFVRAAFEDYLNTHDWHKSQRKLVWRLRPDIDTFKILERCYSGGITHANYKASLFGTYDNIQSYDKASSYPWSIVSQKYPMSSFRRADNPRYFMTRPEYCWMCKITFYNIVARYDNCIISKHKCVELGHKKADNGKWVPDYHDSNGRIYKASKLAIYITDVDYCNICKMYQYMDNGLRRDITIDDIDIDLDTFRWATYGYLPKSLVLFTLELYHNKTTLKNVAGKEDLYQKSKRNINSLYGMCVLNPCADSVQYPDDLQEWITCKAVDDLPEDDKDHPELMPIANLLKKYYDRRKTVLVYQWGVWITAHSRASLCDAMAAVGNDCLYVDTDSVKFTGDHAADFDAINAKIHADNVAAATHWHIDFDLYAPTDPQGNVHEIGLFEYEYTARRFKTVGCKRYLVEYTDGHLDATVAGAPKDHINKYLSDCPDPFNAFCTTLRLSGEYVLDPCTGRHDNQSGKTTMAYIDTAPNTDIEMIDYTGTMRKVHIYPHCIHASGAPFRMTDPPGYALFKEWAGVSERVEIIRHGVTI